MPPRTYRELYADAANNPPPDRIAGYLAGYCFAGDGDIPTPAQLRDQTVSLSDCQAMAFFLCLVNGQDGAPDVTIVHPLLRFVDSLGDEASGFHDRVLGFPGDIMPHQYPAVEVLSTTFHLIGTAAHVPTVEIMDSLLPAWEDPNIPLGPYVHGDPDTEVVRPRNSQLIPGKYASLIIHRRRIKAYQEIVGAIRADKAMVACADIVTWLRAACTARGGGGANNAVPSVLHALTPLHLPPEVYLYVTHKVHTDLPGTAKGGGANAGSKASLVGALRALTDRGDGGRGLRSDTKSITEASKETHWVLLRYCNVREADEVASIWRRLANGHKREQHTLITQELQKVCVARGLSTQLYVPIVTTTLKQMVVGFQFPGHSPDDLSTGCQPFLVACYAGKAHHLQVTAAATTADQLAQGDQNASLADIRTIREGEKVKFPLNASEVCVTLYRYAILCETLFQGAWPKHPFVDALWTVATAIKDVEPFITDKYNNLASIHPITSVFYTRIVRAVQVYSQEYLHQVAMYNGDDISDVPVPSFASLVQELTRGTFPKSTNYMDLPAEYMETATLRAPAATASIRTTSTAPSTVPRADQSTVSTLSGTAATTQDNTRVVNPSPDSACTEITMRSGGSRQIRREDPPPVNDHQNHKMCVAWWTRSACYSNCGRRQTHRPFANNAERARLMAYVREHLAAPEAGSSAT